MSRRLCVQDAVLVNISSVDSNLKQTQSNTGDDQSIQNVYKIGIIQYIGIIDGVDSIMTEWKGCNLSNCLLLQRNGRDRFQIKQNDGLLRDLYFGADIVEQQLLDTIHCNFMHSYDRGMRLSLNLKNWYYQMMQN